MAKEHDFPGQYSEYVPNPEKIQTTITRYDDEGRQIGSPIVRYDAGGTILTYDRNNRVVSIQQVVVPPDQDSEPDAPLIIDITRIDLDRKDRPGDGSTQT